MADGTKIEWTDATWNVVNGCSVVSPGCANCYAMRLAGTRLKNIESRKGLTIDTKAGPVWNGTTRFNKPVLLDPVRWQRPRRIFVCAHGDLFHDSVPDEWIDKAFAVMALASQHQFQVLTKRAERMQRYLASSEVVRRIMSAALILVRETAPDPDKRPRQFQKHHRRFAAMTAWTVAGGTASDMFLRSEPNRSHPSWVAWPLPNVWTGVSVENNKAVHDRAYALKCTPAVVRFWSAEPLLGPITNFPAGWLPDWVIVGGESGPGARPMQNDWAQSLVDQCAAAGVPAFVKQLSSGGPRPIKDIEQFPEQLRVREMPA